MKRKFTTILLIVILTISALAPAAAALAQETAPQSNVKIMPGVNTQPNSRASAVYAFYPPAPELSVPAPTNSPVLTPRIILPQQTAMPRPTFNFTAPAPDPTYRITPPVPTPVPKVTLPPPAPRPTKAPPTLHYITIERAPTPTLRPDWPVYRPEPTPTIPIPELPPEWPIPSPTPEQTPEPNDDVKVGEDMLALVNAERKLKGGPALSLDTDLMAAAKLRAEEISVLFSHERPDGTSCFTASPKMFAENIAQNYSGAPEGAMKQWMNSEGHRNNILNPSYRTMGCAGFCLGGAWYWVQVFGF